MDLVAGFDDEVPVGDDDLVPPLYGADQDLHPDPIRKGVKVHAVQNASGLYLDLCQLHPAPGEGFDVDGRGEPQGAADLGGCFHFRVHRHAEPQFLPEEGKLLGVFGVPDPGNGVAGADLFADHAA